MVLQAGCRRSIALCGVAGWLLVGPVANAQNTIYAYDALGRLVSATDPDGKAVLYAYDANGNRTQYSGLGVGEAIPLSFSASASADPAFTGLSPVSGMRDGKFTTAATSYSTTLAAGSFIQADLGVAKTVNNIDIMAAVTTAPIALGVAQTNAAEVHHSLDGANWTAAGVVSGVTAGSCASISLGGVQARYVRLRQPANQRMALGEFRIFMGPRLANRAPTAQTDPPVTLGTGQQTITFDPLGNDIDPDGDAIRVTGVSGMTKGTAAPAQNGTAITYTRTNGVSGADTFSYTITDCRGMTSTAQVTVSGTAANRPPVAVPDTGLFTPHNTPLVVAVLNNDSDPDPGDAPAISGFQTTSDRGGSVTQVGNSLRYSPGTSISNVTDQFTYNIVDSSGAPASAYVQVSVGARPNRPPVANPDGPYLAGRWGGTGAIPVLANDSDPDFDPLTIVGATSGAGGVGNVTGGNLFYDSNGAVGYGGTDSFQYSISDGRNPPVSATVQIQISPNRPPVAQQSATADIVGNGGETFTVSHSQATFTDPDDPTGTHLTVVDAFSNRGLASFSGGQIHWQSMAFSGQDLIHFTVQDDGGLTAFGTISINFTCQGVNCGIEP